VCQVKSRLLFVVLLLAAAAGALAFRLPRLCDRPMHADEAVQAARSRDLWLRGRYVYDPNEFHGPTLQYATLPSLWVGPAKSFAETNEATYRIVPVLFGTGLILLLWLLSDAVGKPAALCAGVLTAVSPAFVYYSRYYIHETLLVFFILSAIGAGWRYARSGKLAWCLAAGGFVGLMQATKETSVATYLAAAVALIGCLLWARLLGEAAPEDRPTRPGWHLALGAAAAIAVAAVLLSSLFSNPRGPIDGVLAYRPWLVRAGGDSPHVHQWYYYLHILTWWHRGGGPVWSEGFILALAALGFGLGLLPKRTLTPAASPSFVRWLGFYTLALTAAYSMIPYKTPWCLLGFLQGMILLAGVGAVGLVRIAPGIPLKVLMTLALMGVACHSAWQSYRASFVMPADPGNPYAYVHTLPDVVRLAGDLEELAKVIPEDEETAVKVIWHDAYYWPLPWYLRGFEHVELWRGMPADPRGTGIMPVPPPLVISSPRFDAPLTERLDATHLMTGYYGVRPNVLAQLWVRMDVWEAHLRRLGRL